MVSAGLTDALPLGRNRTWGIGVKGRTYAKDQSAGAYVRVVSDGYITAMGIPIRAGRDLTERDAASNDPVILLNETIARTLFPGEDAIGKIVRTDKERRVVGAAGAWILSRWMGGMLYSTTASDPVTFLGMVLGTVSTIAGYLPARRASRIDPAVALRAN